MQLDRFLAERSGNWSDLEALVTRAGVSGAKLSPADLRRLGTLYRSATADLAMARRSFPDSPGTMRLEGLVASAHGVVYARAERQETAGEFFSRGLWRRIRQSLGCVGIAAAVLLGATVLGAIWALVAPATASGLLPAGVQAPGPSFHGAYYGISVTARAGLAFEIFINNIQVAFLAVAGGFTLGLLTVFSLAYNGALLGVLGALEWRAGGLASFVRLIVPHGMLELSCISLAGGAGLLIAKALIDPGRRSRAEKLGTLVPVIGACLLGTMIFLVVAGLTEGFITPWDLPTIPALAVGCVLAGGFWTMVVVRGRTTAPAPRVTTGPVV